jgi:hypothetical protein
MKPMSSTELGGIKKQQSANDGDDREWGREDAAGD